jgi:hypothetical protein
VRLLDRPKLGFKSYGGRLMCKTYATECQFLRASLGANANLPKSLSGASLAHISRETESPPATADHTRWAEAESLGHE